MRAFEKHPLGSLTKGRLYFTKEQTRIYGENVIPKYWFRPYEVHQKALTGSIIIYNERKPIIYLGNEYVGALYPLFLFNDGKYVLQSINFAGINKKQNIFAGINRLNCDLSCVSINKYFFSEKDILSKA